MQVSSDIQNRLLLEELTETNKALNSAGPGMIKFDGMRDYVQADVGGFNVPPESAGLPTLEPTPSGTYSVQATGDGKTPFVMQRVPDAPSPDERTEGDAMMEFFKGTK